MAKKAKRHQIGIVAGKVKRRRRRIRLDPGTVLALCKQFIGYDGVVKYLAEKGLVNPDTRKPFTKHAICYAASLAPGYKEWRDEREDQRKDTAKEFERIARLAMATKKRKRKAAAS